MRDTLNTQSPSRVFTDALGGQLGSRHSNDVVTGEIIMKRIRRRKPQPANIFKGETEKVRVSEMLDDPNPESGFHDDKLWVHRKIGIGIATPLRPKIENRILEKSTRLGTQTDKFGSRFRRRAFMTFPKNRCARCTRMLSERQRHTIEAEGQEYGLTFCLGCATDMVSES